MFTAEITINWGSRKGDIVRRHETKSAAEMADYLVKMYGNIDPLSGDSACVYENLAAFLGDESNFIDGDKDNGLELDTNVGENPANMPTDSQLLYIGGNSGWELIPVADAEAVIDYMTSIDWADAWASVVKMDSEGSVQQ